MRPLRVLTWYGSGNYLKYLAQARADFLIPVPPEQYSRTRFPLQRLGPNVCEIPADLVRGEHIDCILYPSRHHFETEGPAVLSAAQRRRLPRIYLEFDPPDYPGTELHWSDDRDGLIVFATAFAALTWDPGRTPGRLIEHGVSVPDSARCTGRLARGVTVLDPRAGRSRRSGLDLLDQLRRHVPLDLAGEDDPGAGPGPDLRWAVADYRFYCCPTRWGGLPLATVEAMAAGMPVVGLAASDLAAVVRSGEAGFVEPDAGRLVDAIRRLLVDPMLARRLGATARAIAADRFGLKRFVRDWEDALSLVTGRRPGRMPAVSLAA